MPRWHVLLAAVAVAGGAILIENGNRVDTSPPDDDIVARAPASTRCTVVYEGREQMSPADKAILRKKVAAALPPACANR